MRVVIKEKVEKHQKILRIATVSEIVYRGRDGKPKFVLRLNKKPRTIHHYGEVEFEMFGTILEIREKPKV